MDETSARRGHDYVSIFMDLTARRVVFATAGKDAATVEAFADDLGAHGGEPGTQIQRVTCDRSSAFIKGIREHLSTAADTAADVVADTAPDAGGTPNPHDLAKSQSSCGSELTPALSFHCAVAAAAQSARLTARR